MNKNPPQKSSLYVHIPFCQRKCPYCSFVVYVARKKRIDAYLNALAEEAKSYSGTRLETVYIGGGSPSLLSLAQLERLRGIISEHFDISSIKESTLEANPEDISLEKIKLFKEWGLSRISLGVQSFDERFLKILDRSHTAAKAIEAFSLLRQEGFQNINMDLMFGLPGQMLPDLKMDIEAMLSFHSDHLSIYSLTVEPHSRFYVAKIKPQEEEEQKGFYEFIVSRLEAAGMAQYEVSNFSQPGKESLHNLNYWSGGDYVGLGVAAHSHHQGRRSWNVSGLEEYIHRLERGDSPEEGYEELTPAQRLQEAVVFGLRMNQGIDLAELEKRFSVSLPAAQQEKINEFVCTGYLEQQGPRLCTTFCGRMVLDELAVYLI